jgi:hypothetical protein
MTEEIWKDLPGYEGLYKISNQCSPDITHKRISKMFKVFRASISLILEGKTWVWL